ncbi:hypothetical protein [Parasphingorhabdus flavimaris]|uniref:hypothetical protein n=1 Tax=Parasphingorhabdus flavimaris TaxID=266812 RepID=UPI003002B4AE
MSFYQSLNRTLLYAFLFVYLSYILFFDLRIFSSRLGIPTPELGFLLLIWGVLLAPFCLYFGLFIKMTRETGPLIVLFSIYVISGVALGVTNGNPIEDVSGDFLKSLFIPAGVGIYFLFKNDKNFVEKTLYFIGATFVFARTVLFIAAFGSFSSLYFGTKMDALLICLGLKRFSEHRVARPKKKRAAFIDLIVIAASLIGQKRALLATLVVYLSHNNKRLLLFVTLSVFVVILSMDSLDWRQVPFIGRFLSLTDIQFMLANQSMRLAEVTTAFSAWTSGIGAFLFGHGFGAEILVFTGRESYAEELHSLHNTPMAILYRSGMFGFCLIVYLLMVALKGVTRGYGSDGAIILALFLTSFFIYSFIDEVFVGYFAAKILDSCRSSKLRAGMRRTSRSSSPRI